MDSQTRSKMIISGIQSDKSSFTASLLRAVLVSYLGSSVPSSYSSIPIFDFICYYRGKSVLKDKYSSMFCAELKQMDSILSTAISKEKSLILVESYAISTTPQDSIIHLRSVIEILFEVNAYVIISSNNILHSILV